MGCFGLHVSFLSDYLVEKNYVQGSLKSQFGN